VLNPKEFYPSFHRMLFLALPGIFPHLILTKFLGLLVLSVCKLFQEFQFYFQLEISSVIVHQRIKCTALVCSITWHIYGDIGLIKPVSDGRIKVIGLLSPYTNMFHVSVHMFSFASRTQVCLHCYKGFVVDVVCYVITLDYFHFKTSVNKRRICIVIT
jgi:hypothetical protein